jgi:hypothetical protein
VFTTYPQATWHSGLGSHTFGQYWVVASTDDLLALVRAALDEFDDRPLEASVRRTIRIANLLGDSFTAVRLGLELKPKGGDKLANAEDTRRLLSDPASWRDPNGPTERALTEHINDRTFPDRPDRPTDLAGKVLSHSLGELEFFDAEFASFGTDAPPESADSFFVRMVGNEVILRTRHRTFTALCHWERQLSYANTNERIFTRFQDRVDELLASGVPDLLTKFSSVYRRLREGATNAPDQDAGEELSQALTSCRRILEAVADHVWPPSRPATLRDGKPAGTDQYRARLRCFTEASTGSTTVHAALDAEIGGLYERYEAADKLASKGVHAAVALPEAELCAISTYIICGEILRIHEAREDGAHES